MSKIYLSFYVFFYCIFSTVFVQAASFDCAKAASFVEHSVCDDNELSVLDDNLSSLYKKNIQSSVDVGGLKQEQRDWLNIRNTCNDANCIKLAYQQRIDVLQNSQSPQEPIVSSSFFESNPEEMSDQNVVEPITRTDQSIASVNQMSSVRESAEPSTSLEISPAKSPDVQQEQRKISLSTLQKKIIAVILLINMCFSIYLHHEGKLTIYADYTDASFTGLSPLLSFLLFLILIFFEVPNTIALTISFVFFGIMLIYVIKATYESNGISLYALMALLTKLCVVGLYYMLMIMLLCVGATRKKGESEASFEERRRRSAQQSAAAVSASTLLFIALSAWICRKDEFTPLDKYLAFNAQTGAP